MRTYGDSRLSQTNGAISSIGCRFGSVSCRLLQESPATHHAGVPVGLIDELKADFSRQGVTTLYVKPLCANQDDEKNQTYLGGGLGGGRADAA